MVTNCKLFVSIIGKFLLQSLDVKLGQEVLSVTNQVASENGLCNLEEYVP